MEQKKIINFIKEFQKENNKKFYQNDSILNFSFFIKNLKIDINENIIFKTINKINNLEYKKPENIYLKNSEIAVSDDFIFLSNENYIKKFKNIKNKKLSIVPKKEIENSEINRTNKVLSEKKSEIVILKEMKKNIENEVEKFEIKIKKNQLELYFIKNRKKSKKILINKLDFNENKILAKRIIDYIIKNYKERKIDIKEKEIDENNYDYYIKLNNNFLINIDNFGLNKFTLKELKNAIKKESGIILISSEKNSGKTSLLKSIAKEMIEKNKSVSVYTDESSFDEMNINVYKGKKIKNLSSNDVIIIDSKINNKVFNKIIKSSMEGSLVIISIEAKCFFDTLKIINYNYKIKKELLADEIIGFLSIQIAKKACLSNSNEIFFNEININEKFESYENYKKNAIILKESKDDIEEKEKIILSEWVGNSDFLKKSLTKSFNINKIKIEQKSLDWYDIIEDGLNNLNKKNITLEEFLRSISLK